MTTWQLVLVILGGVVTLAAAAQGAAYLARGLVAVVHKVDQINDLTQRELTHNHGTSMKDDTYGMALAIGQLQRDRDDEHERVNRLLTIAAEHHPENAALYLALRRPL